MGVDPRSLQHRGGLEAVRSVLIGLVVVGLLGIVGALTSYRADVAEARTQVAARVSQACQLYADSLALHFELLRSELQRLAEHPVERLRAPDKELLSVVRDDRNLFAGGVGLLDETGRVLWSDPPAALPGDSLSHAPWFQRVLATEKPAVDELLSDDTSRIAVALPVRDGGRLVGVLVGIVSTSDRLLYGVEGPGEQLLLLSSRGRVLLPLSEPEWSRRADFSSRVDQLTRHEPEIWRIGGTDVVAKVAGVRDTALDVLALETEDAAITPIRRRLNLQLAFLLVLQLVAVGAFTLFLRRTWRTFLDVEARVAAQEKMAALGAASSLIAHEVKNSLNGLKAATSLLEAGGDAQLATKTMKGQVERLGHLARSLLSFARPDATRLAEVDVSAVVREAVQGLAALPEASEATVELEVPERLPLKSDPLLLATAVDNLVRNAIEAAVAAKDMGTGTSAKVTVRARQDGAQVLVSVEDAAGGPPKDFEAHMGEPFVTSKPRGIGLGLTMTQRAAEQLGGRLSFTRTAQGSRFELALPVR
ncbi:MAG: ATP-binding protein [Myxococcota bacterium]